MDVSTLPEQRLPQPREYVRLSRPVDSRAARVRWATLTMAVSLVVMGLVALAAQLTG